MQELYLIRHGQAGLRSDYDQLSELGQQQARLLGDWFGQQGIEFDVIRSGGLRRQRKTAEAIGEGVQEDPQWNEFDLDAVYAAIAPQLAGVDAAFRAEYEALQAEAQNPDHPVHRSWRPSDLAVVRAWISNRFPVDCETWEQFQQRVWGAIASLDDLKGARRIALVTSATPIGIATAKLFEAPVKTVFELAGNLNNASFTVLRRRNDAWTLAGFNHTPHLGEEMLRTLR